MANNVFKVFKDGIINNNPSFVQVVGMCPLLAVTTAAVNGIGMGLATTGVLICSNLVISLLRKFIPDKVRIPCYVVIIASFVTLVEFLMKAYAPASINASLGIFIPLIVVNCIILARAESFANKNNALRSFFDGLGNGLGFTAALVVIGSIREILGNGSIFGAAVLPDSFPRTVMMILPPGAFFTFAFLMAGYEYVMNKSGK